jgi:hypothetical protein
MSSLKHFTTQAFAAVHGPPNLAEQYCLHNQVYPSSQELHERFLPGPLAECSQNMQVAKAQDYLGHGYG